MFESMETYFESDDDDSSKSETSFCYEEMKWEDDIKIPIILDSFIYLAQVYMAGEMDKLLDGIENDEETVNFEIKSSTSDKITSYGVNYGKIKDKLICKFGKSTTGLERIKGYQYPKNKPSEYQTDPKFILICPIPSFLLTEAEDYLKSILCKRYLIEPNHKKKEGILLEKQEDGSPNLDDIKKCFESAYSIYNNLFPAVSIQSKILQKEKEDLEGVIKDLTQQNHDLTTKSYKQEIKELKEEISRLKKMEKEPSEEKKTK